MSSVSWTFTTAALLAVLSCRLWAADPLSPAALASSPDGNLLFAACTTGNQLAVVDVQAGTVIRRVAVPGQPTGVAVGVDGSRVWVTSGGPEGRVSVVDVARGKIVGRLKAGHTPNAPVLSKDNRTLYVCNRFNDDVSFLDTASGKELHRVKVLREPVAADLTSDGKHLLVANLLHDGRADLDEVAAAVSVIDTTTAAVVKQLRLPNGSGSVLGLRVSPDGKYAVVTHLVSRFHLPTTQLDRGWINTNAKTLIDLGRLEVMNTILLDNVDRGAANPWGIAWSADSRTLVITHAGTHEISVIDFPGVLAKLAGIPREPKQGEGVDYRSASRTQAEVPNDLAFLVGLQRRIRLPEADLGPRSVAMAGDRVCVANYFSDSIAVLDPKASYPRWKSISLGPKVEMSLARKGDLYFHDARICFQGWQSCASCHPGEGRVDALNWDLLNDGIGNPKNNKSLLLTHRTPPAMSMGVRETGEEAVRAGIRHILFSVQPPEVGNALDAYLKGLQPVASPLLNDRGSSRAVQRGKKLFNDSRTACASCHPAGLFTDMQSYDVGTTGKYDKPAERYDTPTLIELWRTAPYLHDGSAATLKDVLTIRNPRDAHGRTSHLSEEQLRDLEAYLLSL